MLDWSIVAKKFLVHSGITTATVGTASLLGLPLQAGNVFSVLVVAMVQGVLTAILNAINHMSPPKSPSYQVDDDVLVD